MKLFINFAIFVVGFSIVEAKEFSEEEMKMFLPFIRHWVPRSCPMNELYKTCVSKCSDCNDRGACIVLKCEEGCDCAPRFFRVTPDGPCEPVANCPRPVCGENEIFRECGPVCETCRRMECRIISCDHKCYCKEGYRRNEERVCIPTKECPARTRCTHTEEWAESGLEDEVCMHGIDEAVSNKTRDVAGCYCKEGHKRNVLGHCINETLCPFVQCFGNETYQECIPTCNTTCRNYGDTNCTEDKNCYSGCFCKPGYVMNDFRSCIEIEKCSLDIEQVKVLNTPNEDENTDSTLPPTCSTTDETTTATDSASTELDDTKAEAAEVTTSVTASTEETPTTPSPTSATSVSDLTPREKPQKKDKVTKPKEAKRESAAKEKEATKYEMIEDEDGFANEDI